MRITNVRIEDFRSIRLLDLNVDKPFIIFEGANDAGKSNILQAIDLTLRQASWSLIDQRQQSHQSTAKVLQPEWPSGLNPSTIIRQGASAATVVLKLNLSEREASDVGLSAGTTLELNGRWSDEVTAAGQPTRRFNFVYSGEPLNENMPGLARLLGAVLRHIGTDRHIEDEPFFGSDDVDLRFQQRRIKNLLFAYKNHPSIEVQGRFEELRRQCSEPDLPIGELTVGLQGRQKLFARTRKDGITLDLEDRASGVQQLVFLLGLALCHEGTILAIEEPELNLSAELQRLLWRKLREFATSAGILHQVFVTSHSYVFETEAERITVRRGADGWTEASIVPPVPQETGEFKPITVGRSNEITLPSELQSRLTAEDGRTVYYRVDPVGIRLLTADEYGKIELGEAELADDER